MSNQLSDLEKLDTARRMSETSSVRANSILSMFGELSVEIVTFRAKTTLENRQPDTRFREYERDWTDC
jgi:hypothetical protein